MKTTLFAFAMTVAVLSFNTKDLRADDDNKPKKPKHESKHDKDIDPDRGLKPKDKDIQGKPDGGQKVSINHKGKIISVDEHALKAHLKHGDTVVSGGAPIPNIPIPKLPTPNLPVPNLPGNPPDLPGKGKLPKP